MLSFGKRSRRSRRLRKLRRLQRSRRSRRSRRSQRLRKGLRGGKIYIKPKGMKCKKFLSNKISDIMREYNSGKLMSNGRKINSRKQAIAIAYSIVRNSGCKI